MRREVIIGVDLGQRRDYTALVAVEVVELVERVEPAWLRPPVRQVQYWVRHGERLPLGSPFREAVRRVRELVGEAKLLPVTVVVDGTGVGAPVVEEMQRADVGARVVGAMITSGERARMEGGWVWVPKVDLVGAVGVLLEQGRLRVPVGMAEREQLVREMMGFRMWMGRGGVRYGGKKEHDDLVMALGLACWWGREKKTGGECGAGRVV